MRKTLLSGFYALLTLAAAAQDPLPAKVLRLDKLELAPGIITAEIADRFRASIPDVDSRIRGAVLATLGQELSSSKLLSLAVREDSLRRLAAEWEVREQFATGRAETGPALEGASFLAFAKIEDFVADYDVRENVAGKVAAWKLSIVISLEVTELKGGTKRVIKEPFECNGGGVVSTRRAEAPDFGSSAVRNLADGVAKKLGMRLLDSLCPPRITQVRGMQLIVDRGRAAGMKEGQRVEVSEPPEDPSAAAEGFPVGMAVVKSVREDSSVLEMISAEGETDLSKVEIKKTYKVSRIPDSSPTNCR